MTLAVLTMLAAVKSRDAESQTALLVVSVRRTGQALALPVGVLWMTDAEPIILAPAKIATLPPLILALRPLVTTTLPDDTTTLATLLMLAESTFVTTTLPL